MADITVHVPDDRVSEFYLMLGSSLARGAGGPQDPREAPQEAQQCTAAGRRTPWRELTIPSGGSTYWIETEAADLFRRLQPELNLLSAIDAFFGEDRPKPRRSAPPTGTR